MSDVLAQMSGTTLIGDTLQIGGGGLGGVPPEDVKCIPGQTYTCAASMMYINVQPIGNGGVVSVIDDLEGQYLMLILRKRFGNGGFRDIWIGFSIAIILPIILALFAIIFGWV